MPMTFTDNGTFQEWRTWDDEGGGSSTSPIPGLWNWTYDSESGVLSFTECYLPRGTAVKIMDGDGASVLSVSMPGGAADGEARYLGVKWNTQTGHVTEITCKTTFPQLVDQTPNDDSEFVLGPICKMEKSGSMWVEKCDYRHLLIGVLNA